MECLWPNIYFDVDFLSLFSLSLPESWIPECLWPISFIVIFQFLLTDLYLNGDTTILTSCIYYYSFPRLRTESLRIEEKVFMAWIDESLSRVPCMNLGRVEWDHLFHLFFFFWGGGGCATLGAAQGLFLALCSGVIFGSAWDRLWCQRSNLGWLNARQVPCALYYFPSSSHYLLKSLLEEEKNSHCSWKSGIDQIVLKGIEWWSQNFRIMECQTLAPLSQII